jgi:hypothetical protein
VSLPRVTLLESEYLRAVADAELRWVSSVMDDLLAGSLRWSYEDFEAVIAQDEASLAALNPDAKPLPSA